MPENDLTQLSANIASIRDASAQAAQSAQAASQNIQNVKKQNVKNIFNDQVKVIQRQANRALQDALSGFILEGKSFKSVFRQFTNQFLQGIIQQSLNINPFARVRPFARGGILSAPALFPLGRNGLGLAGEAGPEAIMPLARGADGRLGVRSQGAQRPTMIQVHIQTPNPDSFRRSQTQTAALLRRAVLRGQRNQ